MPKQPKAGKETFATNFGFCTAGIIASFANITGISAAVDLVGEDFPKSVVLFCDIIPGFVLALTYPFAMNWLKIWPLCVVTSVLGSVGFLLAGLGRSIGLRLLGVVCFSLQTGMEPALLALSGGYYPDTSGSFSIGLGIAGVLGSTAYVLLTEALGIDPSTVLLSFTPFPLLISGSLALILWHPSRKLLF